MSEPNSREPGSIEKAHTDVSSEIDRIERAKIRLYDTAMKSDDPDVIVKATNYLNSDKKQGQATGLQIKSLLTDPLEYVAAFGYKDKPSRLSYYFLNRMSKTPFTAATIGTRVAQVTKFAVPQEDEFALGFKIQPKMKNKKKANRAQLKRAEELTQFLLDGGLGGYKWGRDDFETFIAKLIRDSLMYDQYTFEIAENRKGVPAEFIATDASTFRVAIPDDGRADYDADPLTGQRCLPRYVQVYNASIENEYYPWQLCFGVRNPRTDLSVSGYGFSELEQLVQTITSMLCAEEYNRRFFSQGSAPKGIIRITGNIPSDKLQDFKREWQMQMAGVYNAWKTPIMQAEKMDFIDLQRSNKDMEYSQWQSFLMKIHSALFLIDPSEMGFDISRSEQGNSLFESNNEQRIKYSRDKGLVPILRSVAKSINRHIIWRIDPEYEFSFMGVDAITPDTALDRAIKELTNFKSLDEIREQFNLKPIGEELGGNLILNATWMSWYNNQQLMKQQQGGGGGEEGGLDFGQEDEDYDPLKDEGEEPDFGEDTEKAFDNPFVADLENFVKGLQ